MELIKNLMYAAAVVCLPVLTKYVTDWLKEKTNETRYAEIAEIVASAVEETNQTYVDSLKASGEFTKEAQEKALEKTLTTAIQLLGNDLRNLIIKSVGDLENYLTTMIESYIKIHK